MVCSCKEIEAFFVFGGYYHILSCYLPTHIFCYYIAVLMDVNGAEIPRRYALSG